MKTVKKRTVSIIHELIGNEELMTLSELAEKFEVSQRTIRNDLKLINELLKEMDLGKIRLVGGRIICPSSFGQVLKAVPKDDLYTYKLSQEERIEIAASFLINTVEYITMSVIADNLVVSRSTVINDLSKIKAYIGQGNLKVHMKAFFSLISMFRNNTFKRKLRECKTSQDAAHLIEEYEFE